MFLFLKENQTFDMISRCDCKSTPFLSALRGLNKQGYKCRRKWTVFNLRLCNMDGCVIESVSELLLEYSGVFTRWAVNK